LPAPPEDLLDRFRVAATAPAAPPLPADAPAEPVLASPPWLVEFDGGGRRLDPARATPEPEQPPAPRRQQTSPLGLIGSVAVHLSPLLLLVSWSSAPAEIAPPIPIQLVLEEPPPAPAPPPVLEAKPPAPAPEANAPPPGRLASRDTGGAGEMTGPPTDEAPHEAAETPAETQLAMVAPPPKPTPPPPELASALPPPVATPGPLPMPQDLMLAPVPEPPAAPLEAKPLPPVKRPAKQAVAAWPLPPQRVARTPGPAATRDEYLVYCEALIRRYHDMLPSSFLAGRRGATTISILVLGDGTIARMAVAQSSGHPDIDSRILQMVSAVRRFPPLPPRFEGSSAPFLFHKVFP
jgi:TonB family protein